MGLPWGRMDTNLPSHDKILDLLDMAGPLKGKAAGFVYCMSIMYAVGAGTEGLIKRTALPFVHATPADVKLLVAVGLWEVAEGGWRIKNYGNRNAVGLAQQALSEIRAEAGRKGAAVTNNR